MGSRKIPLFATSRKDLGELNPDQDGKEQSDLCGSLRRKANQKRGQGGGGGGGQVETEVTKRVSRVAGDMKR